MSENAEKPNDISIALSCDQCSAHPPFPSLLRLMRHIRKTEGHTCCCKLCNITFKNWTYLRQHKRLYHVQREDAGDFPCETCGKPFKTTALLNHHWKNVHKVEKNLNCNLCGMACQNMSKLRNHTFKCLTKSPRFQEVHQAHLALLEQTSLLVPTSPLDNQDNEIKVENESIDGEMYSYGVAHLVEPQLTSAVKMEEMSKSENDSLGGFKENVNDMKHDWIKSEAEPMHGEVQGKYMKSPITTKVCPICTSEVKYLERHIKTHHPGEQTEVHPCKECPKSYPSAKKLYLHWYSVHRDLPIQCEVCQQMFKNPSALRNHKNAAHAENSEQICQICYNIFESKMKLYQHNRHVHK